MQEHQPLVVADGELSFAKSPSQRLRFLRIALVVALFVVMLAVIIGLSVSLYKSNSGNINGLLSCNVPNYRDALNIAPWRDNRQRLASVFNQTLRGKGECELILFVICLRSSS
jgi:hypothetical protein